MIKERRIRTICVGCHTVLVDVPPGPRGEVSHGLCEACLRERAAEYGFTDEDIREILATDGEQSSG